MVRDVVLTVIRVEEHFFISHHLAQSIALRFVKDQTIKLGVVRDIVVEAEAILMTHFRPPILDAAESSAPGHVRVQNTSSVVRPRLVNAGVDPEGRRIG